MKRKEGEDQETLISREGVGEMLFDYRYWLRAFLEWLLDDKDDDACDKMVTKELIGEPFILLIDANHLICMKSGILRTQCSAPQPPSPLS